MGITIDGSSAAGNINLGSNGTISNLAVGGLPNGSVNNADLAADVATALAYDDSNLRRDLTTLALQTAVDTNRKAYNLQNSFIDQYEDDTGLATQTDVDRNTSGEYVSTIGSPTVQPWASDSNTKLLLHFEGSNNDTSGTGFDDSSGNSSNNNSDGGAHIVSGIANGGTTYPRIVTTGGQYKLGSSGMQVWNAKSPNGPDGNGGITSQPALWYDNVTWMTDLFKSTNSWTIEFWIKVMDKPSNGYPYRPFSIAASNSADNTSPHIGGFALQIENDGSTNYARISAYKPDGSGNNFGVGSSRDSPVSTGTWYHYAAVRDGNVFRLYIDGVQKATHTWTGNTITNFTSDLLINGTAYQHSGDDGGTYGSMDGFMDEFRISDNVRYPSGTSFTPNSWASTNATGTLISTANTASSSRTKVSGTVLYKNNAGTATLGTDFKVYFTCNGGTNWTEAASYTAGSDFSTGIKTIYLGETTCTAGTDVRYKVEWANQASGSKETQLHGIGVNY